MSNYEQEIRNEQFKRATGSAPNFRAIDGVGEKTARAVRNVIGINAPSDAADKTADELAEEAGISENRARKVIRGGGGDPDRKPRSTTGSVSAAGIRVATGEFKPEIGDKDAAEARFSSSLNRGIGRSQNAAIADKSKRAPVTTDVDRWKENKGALDFPGVDTPSSEPQVLPKDLRQEQRPATTEPGDTNTQPARESVPETPTGRFASAAETSQLSARDVSLSPGEAFRGDGAVGMNNLGSFSPPSGEERAPLVGTERPPDFERGEDPFDMSDEGGVLSLDSSDRDTIRQLERSAVASGREPEVLESMRFSDEPTAEQRDVFDEVAGSLLSGRDAIEDSTRTDTQFFESETLDDVADLRERVMR